MYIKNKHNFFSVLKRCYSIFWRLLSYSHCDSESQGCQMLQLVAHCQHQYKNLTAMQIKVVEFCSSVWSSLERAHSHSQPLLPAAHYPLDLWWHAFPCDSLIFWNRHISLFTEECSAWKRCSCQHHTDNSSGQHQLITERVNLRPLLQTGFDHKKGEKRRWEAKFEKPYQHRQLYASLSTTESIFHGS